MNSPRRTRLHLLLAATAALLGPVALAADNEPSSLWTIGTSNGAAAEFAPGSRPQLTFTVGQSVVSKDFAGHQEGSVAWDGKVKEKPYTIAFDLAQPPQGDYELVLDLIYSTGRQHR